MKHVCFAFFCLIILISGLLTGLFLDNFFSKTTFLDNIFLNKYIKTKKYEIIGFQPFWLFDKVQNNYSDYITTFAYFSLLIGKDGKIIRKANLQEEEPGWTWLKKSYTKNVLSMYKKQNIKRSLVVHSNNESDINILMKHPKPHAKIFMNDISPIMKEYSFSDLNIDIESFQEASPEARIAYTTFIKEIRKYMDENELGTLTIDISPTALIKSYLIDPRAISPYVDYIVIMAYDFHYRGSTLTGPAAPIGGAGFNREYDVETTLKEALSIFPKEKIILGIPLYGYEWETIVDIPQSAAIPNSSSVASSRRVSQILKKCNTCKMGYDEIAKQPYVIFKNNNEKYFHQIFYENERSLNDKLILVDKNNIGGIALWAIGYEDTRMIPRLKMLQAF